MRPSLDVEFSADDMGHAVAGDVAIAADEMEALMTGLGDQQAVERVAVMMPAACARPGRAGS